MEKGHEFLDGCAQLTVWFDVEFFGDVLCLFQGCFSLFPFSREQVDMGFLTEELSVFKGIDHNEWFTR